MRIIILLILQFLNFGCHHEPEKKIRVNFDSKVIDKLPIEFHPMDPYVQLNPGEKISVKYRFVNVSPEKVSLKTKMYADKSSIQVLEAFPNLILNEKEVRDVNLVFRIPSNISKSTTHLTMKFLALDSTK